MYNYWGGENILSPPHFSYWGGAAPPRPPAFYASDSGDKILPVHTQKTGKLFQRLFHQNNIEHKERTRIDRYTCRRFGDKLFFWSSTK